MVGLGLGSLADQSFAWEQGIVEREMRHVSMPLRIGKQ